MVMPSMDDMYGPAAGTDEPAGDDAASSVFAGTYDDGDDIVDDDDDFDVAAACAADPLTAAPVAAASVHAATLAPAPAPATPAPEAAAPVAATAGPAPTEAPEPATPPVTPPAPVVDRSGNVYARRRAIALGAVVLAIGFLFWSNRPSAMSSSSAEQAGLLAGRDSANATAEGPDGRISAGLGEASTFRTANGTYSGYVTRIPQLRSVAGGDTVVFVTVDGDGSCWMGGVVNGVPTPILPEETGAACTDAQLTQLQAHLDGLDADRANADAETAKADLAADGGLIAQARDAGRRYAEMNYVDGRPSLRGLTSLELDGVTVVEVSSDGLAALVQARSGDACTEFVVTTVDIDAGFAEPHPCE